MPARDPLQPSIKKLLVLVLAVLAGTAFTVRAYLDSKHAEERPAQVAPEEARIEASYPAAHLGPLPSDARFRTG